MASIVVFRYLHRDSLLHRLDSRVKVACLVLFSMAASFASSPVDFAILTFVLFAALLSAQLPIASLVSELAYFALIIVPVVIVQAFTIPGDPVLVLPFATVTVAGLQSGLFFAWRLVVVVILCVILTGTTSLSSIGSAIEWYLRPIPFIPAARIAMMINLTFVFVPLVFDQAAEMMAAQQARCISARKNPIKRITYTALPLLLQTFKRAEEIVLAMEARCYSEQRTQAIFVLSRNDWLMLAASGLILSLILIYP